MTDAKAAIAGIVAGAAPVPPPPPQPEKKRSSRSRSGGQEAGSAARRDREDKTRAGKRRGSAVAARGERDDAAIDLDGTPRGGKAEGRQGIDNEPPPAEPDAIRPEPSGEDLDLRLAFCPLTDLGNAERFVARHKHRLRWCPALGWLWWDGRRWAREGSEDKVKLAEHETVRAIQDEARAIRDSRHDFMVKEKPEVKMWSDTIAWHGRASESATRLQAIGKRAAPYLYVEPGALDADPFKINVANGTLVVDRAAARGGDGEAGRGDEYSDCIRFKPHDPADLITKVAAASYDPDAACPLYDKFLARVQPQAPMRRFLHQWHGLSLTGDVGDQKLAMFWGKGKNGKSTLIDVVAFIAGDYSETVPIETFLSEGRGRNAGQATPDLALLPGVRHLRTSEPKRGAKLDEALIKLATGGEPIIARHLNRDYFKYYPSFKLTISGNYRPQIQGTDEGIWRRMILVPWGFTVPDEERDRSLPAKLKREASGIFNRLLDGLRDWIENGLVEPQEVVDATAAYRADSDPLGRFLEACIEFAQGERVQSSRMHEVFCAWAKANGEREWTNKGMTAALRERGFVSKHSDFNWWLDVKLIRGVNDFVDHEGRPLQGDATAPDGGGDGEYLT